MRTSSYLGKVSIRLLGPFFEAFLIPPTLTASRGVVVGTGVFFSVSARGCGSVLPAKLTSSFLVARSLSNSSPEGIKLLPASSASYRLYSRSANASTIAALVSLDSSNSMRRITILSRIISVYICCRAISNDYL